MKVHMHALLHTVEVQEFKKLLNTHTYIRMYIRTSSGTAHVVGCSRYVHTQHLTLTSHALSKGSGQTGFGARFSHLEEFLSHLVCL